MVERINGAGLDVIGVILSLQKELKILLSLSGSEGVIQCYGDCLSHENGMTIYNLLLEYAPGGSLADLINKYGGKIPKCDVRRYTRMILKGLSSIHDNGYVHCDLKPANILVFPSDQQDFQLKIADFGLAKEPDEGNSRKFLYQYTFHGTPLYMSPESVKLAEISPALDIWSLGCIVIEMITGKPPWHELDVEDILVRLAFEGSSPEIPENM
ncbi:hypothetical protein GH714_002132 [Hevea brasiliensis]|uniref:Protein kinase domain-containing protein n=1 Tax=Hevea brasiliensis TaxID=3981 RepID=A0A6A6MB22_HEVBR|nr:hypothetical protein GH714_002132 [Hevea brasiliensis]